MCNLLSITLIYILYYTGTSEVHMVLNRTLGTSQVQLYQAFCFHDFNETSGHPITRFALL